MSEVVICAQAYIIGQMDGERTVICMSGIGRFEQIMSFLFAGLSDK